MKKTAHLQSRKFCVARPFHRSVANALKIVRFESENFIELRYGLFFGEYDYAIPWINDAFSGRDHDTVSTDDAGNQDAFYIFGYSHKRVQSFYHRCRILSVTFRMPKMH
jgi:hypothetical protein